MNRKKLLITFATVVAFALMVWTIGANVSLSAINFSVNSGDVVSASDFNSAFGTVDSNFQELQNAMPGASQSLEDVNAITGFDGSLQTAHSASIDAPSSGFVVAMVSGYLFVDHASTTTSSFTFGVSDSTTSLPPAQDINVEVPSSAPTGVYDIPFSTQRIFPVSAGTNSFHLLAQEDSGDAAATNGMADVTISLMFVPNEYGTVSTSVSAASSEGEGP